MTRKTYVMNLTRREACRGYNLPYRETKNTTTKLLGWDWDREEIEFTDEGGCFGSYHSVMRIDDIECCDRPFPADSILVLNCVDGPASPSIVQLMRCQRKGHPCENLVPWVPTVPPDHSDTGYYVDVDAWERLSAQVDDIADAAVQRPVRTARTGLQTDR